MSGYHPALQSIYFNVKVNRQKMPIEIQSDAPIPPGRYRTSGLMADLRTAISSMRIGQSFVFLRDNRRPYLAALQIGCKVKTRKLPDGGWRVWKVANKK